MVIIVYTGFKVNTKTLFTVCFGSTIEIYRKQLALSLILLKGYVMENIKTWFFIYVFTLLAL